MDAVQPFRCKLPPACRLQMGVLTRSRVARRSTEASFREREFAGGSPALMLMDACTEVMYAGHHRVPRSPRRNGHLVTEHLPLSGTC